MPRPSSEPFRLSKYSFHDWRYRRQLFTCGRPGRSLGSKVASVPDAVVLRWVHGLPRVGPLHIVSLLGQKPEPSSVSEYSYYSFRGGLDSLVARPGTITFQEWLNLNFRCGAFVISDFPTTDTKPIEPVYLAEICARIDELLRAGENVLIVDSGGVGRTGKVCSALGARANT